MVSPGWYHQATGGHSDSVGAEECPAGQRHSTQNECWAAVVSASRERAGVPPESWPELNVHPLKVIDTPLVPPGCSYSHASKMAVFNTNLAGSKSSLYQLVCVAALMAPIVPAGHVVCERMCIGSSCYPIDNATTRVLDDGTVFAASRALCSRRRARARPMGPWGP